MSFQFTAGRFKGWASDNTPLAGGRLYTYASGTTTHKAAYTDATLGAACTYVSDGVGGLYIALDSKGEAQLWLGSGAYTFKLTDSLGATVWTVDGVRDQQDATKAELASTSDASKGAGMVGFSPTLNYVAGTLGEAVRDNDVNLFWFLSDAEKADVVGRTFLVDVTAKINSALSFAGLRAVYAPAGGYLHSSNINIGYGKRLYGDGPQATEFRATTAIVQFSLTSGFASLENLKISGDAAGRTPTAGLSLYGASSPCIHNKVSNLVIESQQRSIILDGYTSTENPCYWNEFSHITCLHPAIDGVLLTKSGAGDSPNANKFDKVHVYSNGSSISGSGFYIQNGNYWNVFNDCESGLSTTTPTACFRVGAGAARTIINGLYCETAGVIVNVQLDAGSSQTYLTDLLAMSGGSAIYDVAGTGDYKCINAGYPNSYYFGQSVIQTAQVGKVLFDYDGAATTPAASTLYEHRYRNAAPVSGTFNRGSVVWNTNVGVSNGPTGWICTTGGTPGTWQAFGDRYIDGTVTFNPGAIANGAQSALVTATVTGAALGDIVDCSNSVDMQGLNLQAYVSATDTVKVFASNSTGAGVTLSSGTVYLRVRKR